MHWLGGSGVGLAAALWVLVAGCSDDASSDDGYDTGDPTEGWHEPMVDYGVCALPLRDPPCTGTACARSPEAEDYLALMIEVAADAGYEDAFVPTRAEFVPLTGELIIDYQLRVSWFRIAAQLRLVVPDDEDLLRNALVDYVADWYVPHSVANPESIEAAVASCHPLLSYDHCLDNQHDFFVRDSYDWNEPGCPYKSTYVVVDATDASTLVCAVEEEHTCG